MIASHAVVFKRVIIPSLWDRGSEYDCPRNNCMGNGHVGTDGAGPENAHL